MAFDKKEDYMEYYPFLYIKDIYAIVNDWNSQPMKLLHNIFQSYGSIAGLKRFLL